MKVSEEFRRHGGLEYAPMSITFRADVATGYAIRKGVENGALLIKMIIQEHQPPVELTFLSLFPGEAEFLCPPLTMMKPTGREQIIEYDGIKLTIIEVTYFFV